MNKLKNLIFSLLLSVLCGTISAQAQHIDMQQAMEYAAQQLDCPTSVLTLSHTATDPLSGQAAYYAFNRAEGGFAIVAADERVAPVVLAYNGYGAYHQDQLTDDGKCWMNRYVQVVSQTRRQPATTLRRAQRRVTTTPGVPDYVKPIIGNHTYDGTAYEGYWKWHQNGPYNELCPVKDGQQCAVGCVAMSMAMVMSAHRWPLRGEGSIEYLWGNQLLSTSFASHNYDWSQMKDRYWKWGDQTDYTPEQGEFITTLMRDCGYSVRMNYGAGYDGSGAAEENACKALCTYFGYDRSVSHLCRDYCTNQYWENLLRREIAAGRPVMYGGGSRYGAHEYTCDGYDAEGRFFFHMGGTAEDGYYATLGVSGDYNTSQTAIYRIMPATDPNATHKASMVAGSNQDFYWTEDNSISSNVRFFTPVDEMDAELTVAVQRTDDNNCIFYETPQRVHTSNVNNKGTCVTDFSVQGSYPDGTYYIYPVYRQQGSEEWQKVLFGEFCQDRVTLTVSNGSYSYGNNDLKENIEEGKVKINDIIYLLHDDRTAWVTYQNSGHNSYRGDVDIPQTVEHEGQSYTVTRIDDEAFSQCSSVGRITVPTTVTSIGFGAFYGCHGDSILFTEGSHLSSIENYAFAYSGFATIVLPEGVTALGGEAFVRCAFTDFVLPSSVTSLIGSVFSTCYCLQRFTTHAITPPTCSLSADPFVNIQDYEFATMKLYVPEGSVDAYRSHPVWGRFGLIIEGDAPEQEPTPQPEEEKQTEAIPGSYTIQLVGTEYFLSTHAVGGKNMPTCSLSDQAEYFLVQPVQGGYTITSTRTGQRIGYSTSSNKPLSPTDVCDDQLVWSIEDINDPFTRIMRLGSQVGLGTDNYDLASPVYTHLSSQNFYSNCFWTLDRVPGDLVSVSKVELNETTTELQVGASFTLQATVSPANASLRLLQWGTDHPEVATVEDGVITAVSVGQAIITATSIDGSNITAFIFVTVVPEIQPEPEPSESIIVYSISPEAHPELYFTTVAVRDNDFFTYSIQSEPEYFIVTEVEGKYTMQSTRTGQYVGRSTGRDFWNFADEQGLWTITSTTDPTTILWADGKGFGWDNDLVAGKGLFTNKNDFRWVLTPHTYQGPTIGLLTHMVRRALTGKCGAQDVKNVADEMLQARP